MSDLPGRPNLSQLAEAVVEAAGEQIRSAIPGVFASVASDLSTASVQPAVSRAGGESDPAIPDVPVLFPQFSGGQITWPIAAGDPCLLVFGDRSLDEWQRAGGARSVDPTDPRTHDLTDAVAIPLGMGGAASGRSGDISLRLGTAELRLQSGNKVALGAGATEVLSVLSDFLNVFLTTVPLVTPATGVLTGSATTTITALKASLDLIKGGL